MLSQINIQNYIFIENAILDFHKNLNIMTGETGAGKSIFLGALNITLGAHVSADLIKPGKKFLYQKKTKFPASRCQQIVPFL